uniref:Sperm-associated antigen 17 n=1 Tax=Clastoptera arizonana TaxID=38151 RepID=A0A1B6C5M9_9HEMI
MATNKTQPNITTQEFSINIKDDINDSVWNCIVVTTVEKTHSDSEFISLFQDEAKKNLRPVIKGITFESIIHGIKKENVNRKSSNKSKKSDKSKSSYQETNKTTFLTEYEEIVTLILQGLKKGHIPPELLAKLIKKQILFLKQCNLTENAVLPSSPVQNNKEEVKLTDKKKSNRNKSKEKKPDRTKEAKKVVTSINDHPSDGPNLYVVLSGFYDPNLLIEMVKIDIPLKAIIAIDSRHQEIKDEFSTILENTTVNDKPKQENKAKTEKIKIFWENLNSVLDSPENEVLSKDLATVTFAPFHGLEINMQKKDKLKIAYDEMSLVMYKIYDYYKEYQLYINSMKKVHITSEEMFSLENATLYNHLVNLVPIECSTVEIIVYCMLEQVLTWIDNNQTSSNERYINLNLDGKEVKYTNLSVTEDLTTHNTSFKKRCNKPSESQDFVLENTCRPLNNERSLEMFEGKIQSNQCDINFIKTCAHPILIDSCDSIKKMIFHSNPPDLNLDDVLVKMFSRSAITLLWDKYPKHLPNNQKMFNYHLQNFKKSCENFYFDSDYLFKIYFHQMLLQRMMSYYYTNMAENFDGKINEEFFIDKIYNNVLSNKNINNNKTEFEKNINNNKTKENEVDKNFIHKISNIGFKTLYERNEQRKENLTLLKSFLECSELRNLYEDIILTECLQNDKVNDMLFIKELSPKIFTQTVYKIYGEFSEVSYTYFPLTDCFVLWFHNNLDSNHVNNEQIQYELNTFIGFRHFYHFILFKDNKQMDLISNEFKDFKIIVNQAKVTLRKSINGNEQIINNLPTKLECCYDLGPSKINFKESVTNFFSPRGHHVMLKKSKYKKQPTLLFLKIEYFNNVLKFHQCLPINEIQPKIYFTTYNDIIIAAEVKMLFTKTEKSMKNPSGEERVLLEDSGLSVVLPTGLQIELVRTNNELGPFYIRQKYLHRSSSLADEDYRCYFKNGCVIIYRLDKTVDVLFNNSTIVKCKNLTYSKHTSFNKYSAEIFQKGKEKKTKGKIDKTRIKSIKKTKYRTTNKEIDQSLRNEEKNKLSNSIMSNTVSLLLNMESYVISALGECITINGNSENKDDYYTMRIAFDPINEEFYTYRADGTSCLNKHGTLVVNYPDGTRITTSCEDNIQNVPHLNNDYSSLKKNILNVINEEFNGSKQSECSLKSEKERGIIGDNETNENGNKENNTSNNNDKELNQYFVDNSEPGITNLDESFEMIFMDSSFEHEHFASIHFKNSLNQTIIQVPGEITIQIDNNNNNVDVMVSTNTHLMIQESEITFNSLFDRPTRSSLECTTIITLSTNEERLNNSNKIHSFFCKTIDSGGNVFLIDTNGETKMFYRCIQELEMLYPQDHLKTHLLSDRFFVMNRDLSGYEMMQKDSKDVQNFYNDPTSQHSYQVLKNTNFYKFIQQKAILQTRSDKFLMKLNKVLPKKLKRKDLSEPKLFKRLWFPEEFRHVFHSNDIIINQTYYKSVMNNKYNAFELNSFTQIKKVKVDLQKHFNNGLEKYILKCNDKCIEYEKHLAQEPRTEVQVLKSQELLLRVLQNPDLSLDSGLKCELSEEEIKHLFDKIKNKLFFLKKCINTSK